MKGQSITGFMKGLKIILAQMETFPQRSCQTRAIKQAAIPPPTIEDLDLGDYELFPCDCTPQGIRSLEIAYLRSPPLSSLKTKECRLDIRRALDSLEPMSTCKRCSGKEYVRAFLYLLCRTILQRCRAFYQHLVRTYEGKDEQPVLLGDYQLATVEERAALLCMLTYVEIKRFHDCVGRIIETLREQPMFDDDSWALIKGQAYKLAIDTAELRFRFIRC
ncbi:hypothetical protein CDV55_101131 [Aspergillus turcosus]|uniref:Uncharacterized protein n=1 Tax=Aspergillus turcosus TaxID=1245748 RepID=A0A229WU91_9EURO|nr:hypothetical protein CDV55_101131 [Aspergillus turcosus]RLM00590.1 hypothetical protein CFD26_101254 [Aspergillus turcosus]